MIYLHSKALGLLRVEPGQFVGRLRKKIPSELIRTVRGLGYCLSDEDET